MRANALLAWDDPQVAKVEWLPAPEERGSPAARLDLLPDDNAHVANTDSPCLIAG